MIDNILIIEDEKAIQSVLYELLTEAGYRVTLANDGLEGLSQFEKQYFSLILLDIMMPKIDGYAVCEIIRKNSDIPIIMLTAMDEEEAQVKAFELQADDYITKPFSLKLVLMRIEAVLRRTKEKVENHNIFISHGIKLDTNRHTVEVNGKEINLTQLEFDILEVFMKHRNQVLTRDNLINQVWGFLFDSITQATVHKNYLQPDFLHFAILFVLESLGTFVTVLVCSGAILSLKPKEILTKMS